MVYCHSVWHSPVGQSCPVLASLPHPVVWLGHGLIVKSTIARVGGLASLYMWEQEPHQLMQTRTSPCPQDLGYRFPKWAG